MTRMQRFVLRIVPREWAESMERESRQWLVRCSCGHERSVWDVGGIRWKAAGKERMLLKCPQCGRISMHKVYKGVRSG